MFRSYKTQELLTNVATYAALIAIASVSVFPILWTLITSLKFEADIVVEDMIYFPTRLTLDHYVNLWTQSNYPSLVLNSLVITVLTIGICLLTGVIAAYSFSRYNFRGRTTMMLGYLVVRMFPAVLMIVPLFIIMRQAGLFDSLVGLAIAYTSFLLPMFIWMLKGFFDAVPRELESAARTDGATRLTAMIKVVIPVANNGLLATVVFVAIQAWNEFIFALMLTTSQNSRTWPVGLQLLVGEFQLPWGMLAAGGIISIVPVVILFAVVQKTMVTGIMAGSVKG